MFSNHWSLMNHNDIISNHYDLEYSNVYLRTYPPKNKDKGIHRQSDT